MGKFQKLSSLRPARKLRIAGDIRLEYLRELQRKNDLSLLLVCGIIFAVEAYNMARVLGTSVGLGTRNNRIYFFMYCILFLMAALWVALRRPLRRAPVQSQCAAQCVIVGLFFLWHLGLNTYDLYRDPAGGTTVLTTALLGLAFLIQVPYWYSVLQLGVDYLLFRIVMAPLMEAGDRINLTIVFVVALAVSLANAHHTAVTVTQRKQMEELNAKLQELVQLDPLTGLLNKRAVECRAEQMLQSLRPTDGMTLFLLDLDAFKWINDRYGHPCGDRVLTETAAALQDVFADAAGLGRIGGDEFAVLYDRPLTEERVMALERQLGKRLRQIQWQDQPMGVQCSMGVCISGGILCTYAQLYTETDRMLYQAKASGKGRCCVRQLACAGDAGFQAVPV